MKKKLLIAECVLVPLVVVVVWTLLLLPTLLYTIPEKENGGGECSHVPYTGAVCRDILKQRQYNCAFGGEEEEADIKISSAVNQLHDEELARVLNQSGISSVCLSALMPLACFYLFPFCNTTNGQSQTPSQEDCFTVVNGVCKKQMEVASEFIGEHLLNCLDFQEETTSNCSSLPAVNNNYTSEVDVVCSNNFYKANGTCRPECGTWEEYPHSVWLGIEYSLHAVIAFGLLLACVLYTVSFIRRKFMFAFPSILLLYFISSYVLGGIFVLIGNARTSLFCTSQDLIDVYQHNSSIFCNIQGAVVTYTLVQAQLLWLIHALTTCWIVTKPVQKIRFEKAGHMKHLHAAALAVALVIPIVSVAVSFATGGFVIVKFPPIACLTKSNSAYVYAFAGPIVVTYGAAATTTFVLLWKLFKYHVLFKGVLSFGQAERKLLIIFVYVVVVVIVHLSYFAAELSGFEDYQLKIAVYFACETTVGDGGPNSTCNRSPFEDLTSGGNEISFYILFGLLPLVFMVYVVNVEDLKKIWSKCKEKLFYNTSTGDAQMNSTELVLSTMSK